ncbi:MAG: 2-C-methyl-D-erythritol 4-phosphate cytidylyltransferase [Deltaproteobacteria bacterium]|nr:2-C-methyl-D-erythritol 4-phosphate cytidylyltransferase [Deltaproteobacteria bacterium]
MLKNKDDSIRTVAVIPAAGMGKRMGVSRAKQFLTLEGQPLLALTLDAFQNCSAVDAIILVVPSEDVYFCLKEVVERFKFSKVHKVVPGGKRRQDSVRLGIEATGGEYGHVVIHDGVRPLVSSGLIDQAVAAVKRHRAVITAIPARDTVKEVNECQEVTGTYERHRVWLVQTPQVFHYEDIMEAHQNAHREGWNTATDDSVLVEKMGIPVNVIEGSESNIKVTTPFDLELAKFLLSRERMEKEGGRDVS